MDNFKKRLMKKAKGFTLVELLVVIAIIAILSVTAYVALGGQTAKARNSRRMADLSAIQSALEVYFVSNNNLYPDTLDALVTNKQINKIPIDPVQGDSYDYGVPTSGVKKTFQLAAQLEDEDGGTVNTAYIIGNGTDLMTGMGCTYDPASGACDCGSTCNITDATKAFCMPYCLYD